MRSIPVLLLLCVFQAFSPECNGQSTPEENCAYNHFQDVTVTPWTYDSSGDVVEVDITAEAEVCLESVTLFEYNVSELAESAKMSAGFFPYTLLDKKTADLLQWVWGHEFYVVSLSGSATVSLVDLENKTMEGYWNHVPMSIKLFPKDLDELYSIPDIRLILLPEAVSASISRHEIQWVSDGVDDGGASYDRAWASAFWENNSNFDKI